MHLERDVTLRFQPFWREAFWLEAPRNLEYLDTWGGEEKQNTSVVMGFGVNPILMPMGIGASPGPFAEH